MVIDYIKMSLFHDLPGYYTCSALVNVFVTNDQAVSLLLRKGTQKALRLYHCTGCFIDTI